MNNGQGDHRTDNGRVTHFVAGMGTTGTLMGVGKRLKEFNSDIRIVGVEPVLNHRIQGLKNMSESIRRRSSTRGTR